MEQERKDPFFFLEQMQLEEQEVNKRKKGKLKIYLGFAAGIGKTYAMLEEAKKIKKEGIDIVAGYIEPHNRLETRKMEEGLEKIPFLKIEEHGIILNEFDLNAALLRKPQIILVDELAHTNAAGCRHQKRYQDILELLDHGIDVHTTLNIQHIESLNDIVGNLTGITVRERIPDRIFDEADQVKLVDIEVDELVKRMKEGKIYGKDQARRALQNFFTKDKLVSLREIALRRMADRVNRLAEKERMLLGSGGVSANEHIMVCISGAPTNAKVIRAAARMSFAFHAKFTALYVENQKLQNMDESSKKRRDDNIRLARSLGANIAHVYGENVEQQIGEYAKISNVTKLVIGRTKRTFLSAFQKGTMVDRINQYAPRIDIYVIPDLEQEQKTKAVNHYTKYTHNHVYPDKKSLIAMAGMLFICTCIGIGMEKCGLSPVNIVMVYSLILFFVGLLSSYSMNKLNQQNRQIAKRAYRTEILLSNSRKLRRASNREEVIDEIAFQIQKLMNFTVIIYMKKGEKIEEPSVYFRKGIEQADKENRLKQYTSDGEKVIAEWVFENAHRAGCTTHTLPNSEAIYLPVMENEKVFSVVGMVLEEKREIDTFEYGLIQAMLSEAALVLGRM